MSTTALVRTVVMSSQLTTLLCSGPQLPPKPTARNELDGRYLHHMFRHAWWILGLVLVGVGVAVVLSAQAVPSDFGWFAYAPLGGDSDGHMSGSGSIWNRSVLIVTRWQIMGLSVTALGLVVFAAGLGFRLGRRHPHLRES